MDELFSEANSQEISNSSRFAASNERKSLRLAHQGAFGKFGEILTTQLNLQLKQSTRDITLNQEELKIATLQICHAALHQDKNTTTDYAKKSYSKNKYN